MRRRRGEAVPATLARWLPVACRIGGAGGREVFGIAAPAADGRLERVALFEAVPTGTPLRLARPTAGGTVRRSQRVREVRQLDTPVGPLSIHTLHPPPAESDAHDQATVLDPGLAAGR